MKFARIQAEKAEEPSTSVAAMCGLLGVSRAGFYAWAHRAESARSRSNRELTVHISAIHEESRRTYGSPRVHAELRFRGRPVGLHRVARLMRFSGIRARRKRRFVRTTTSDSTLPVAPNVLARDFQAHLPNRVWSTDITYVPTREGWLYLSRLITSRPLPWRASRVPGGVGRVAPVQGRASQGLHCSLGARPGPRRRASPRGPWVS